MVSKELQYGYSKGKAPRLCVKSFSSCFWDTGRGSSSSGCSPSQLSATVSHRRYLASCAKKSVRFSGADFFAL